MKTSLSQFENNDFSKLEGKSEIRFNGDTLEIHAPMGRYSSLKYWFLLATTIAIIAFGFHVSNELPKASGGSFSTLALMIVFTIEGAGLFAFFLAPTLLLFFHHWYTYITKEAITTKHLFLSIPFFTHSLMKKEIGSLVVEQHGATRTNGVEIKYFRIRAFPGLPPNAKKVKIRKTITIIEGIEGDIKPAEGFAQWIQDFMKSPYGGNSQEFQIILKQHSPSKAERMRHNQRQ